MKHTHSLFIFRQDLRVHDNTALHEAIAQSADVLPIFIFDETIVKHFPQHDKRIGFLIEAINELDKELQKR